MNTCKDQTCYSLIHELDSTLSSGYKEAPRSCTEWKAYIGRRKQEKKTSNKEWGFSAKLPYSGGRLGVSRADYLIGVDQVVPDKPVKGHSPGRG